MKKMLLGLLIGFVMTTSVVNATEQELLNAEVQMSDAQMSNVQAAKVQNEEVQATEPVLQEEADWAAKEAGTNAEVVESSIWNGIEWKMYADGTLLVNAVETSVDNFETPDWITAYKDQIKTVEMTSSAGVNVESTRAWFADCVNLTTVYAENWDMSTVTCAESMFKGCTSLATVEASNWNTELIRTADNMFDGCEALLNIDVSDWRFPDLVTASYMFSDCKSLVTLDVSEWGTTENLTKIDFMFENCESLTSINVSNWITWHVENMQYTFYGCKSLTSLDLNNWSVYNSSSVSCMFAECTNLETLLIGDWDTARTRDMSYLFDGCTNLKNLNISQWNVQNAKDMAGMFRGCKSLTALDLSGWYIYRLERVAEAFAGCEKLTTLKFGDWNVSYTERMDRLFMDCKELTSLDLSSWTFDITYDADEMFSGCVKLENLNLENWNTANLFFTNRMFYNCKSLTCLGKFDGVNIEEMIEMFCGCEKLSMELLLGNYTLGNYADYYAVDCFKDAATSDNAAIYVRYAGNLQKSHIEYILATKSPNSHVYMIDVKPVSMNIIGEKYYQIDVGESIEIEVEFDPVDANGSIWAAYTICATADGENRDSIITHYPDPYNRKLVVEGLKEGITRLEVCANYDDAIYAVVDTCTIEVGDVSQICTELTYVEILEDMVFMQEIGEAVQLTLDYFPMNANPLDTVWEIHNDSDGISISETGLVTAHRNGVYLVTAYLPDGTGKTSCQIIVNDPNAEGASNTTDLRINRSEVVLNSIGACVKLDAYWVEDGTLANTLMWFSADPSIAVVDMSGNVEARGVGRTTIYAKNAWPDSIASCEVIVDPSATGGSGGTGDIVGGVTEEQRAQIRSFVERMYTIVLNREADENGLNDWATGLIEQRVDGAAVVNGFVNSAEFVARNLSNEDFIKTLYLAVLNREADEFGISEWMRAFSQGASRQDLIDGFVTSAEFEALCDSYGIISVMTQEDMVRSFASRMYTVALNRPADEAGLTYWVDKLMSGQADGAAIADGFINSPEFIDRHLWNEDYIRVLYRTFLNREADEAGLNDWLGALSQGYSREEVLNAFIATEEFDTLCDSYGISAILTPRDRVTNFVARMYTVALNRAYDEAGLNDWVNGLMDGVIKGAEVAEGFIMSAEFEARGLNNAEYVQTLYRTFFNREASETDVEGWVSAMTVHGQSRREVLKGFINSYEFALLCENYGIVRGEMQ